MDKTRFLDFAWSAFILITLVVAMWAISPSSKKLNGRIAKLQRFGLRVGIRLNNLF
jgi:hypothetical protein